MLHALDTSPRQAWWLATRIRASQADAHKYQLRENSNLYSSSTASTVTSQRPLPLLATCLRAGGADFLKPLQLSAAKGWLLPPPSAARMHTAIIAKSSLLRPSCGRHECWPQKSWAHAHSRTSAMIVKSPLLRPSCCRHQCWPSVSAGRMGRTAPLLSLHAPAGVQQPLPVCASAGLSTLAACAQVRLCYDCTPPLLLSSCCRHLCWPPATCAQQHSRCCQRKCRPPFSAGRMREATPLR